jgi:hypothetical protein
MKRLTALTIIIVYLTYPYGQQLPTDAKRLVQKQISISR